MASNKEDNSSVIRIKAEGGSSSKKAKKSKEAVAKTSTVKSDSRGPSPFIVLRPFVAAGRYFRGAWFELRQVRWPTRGATWSLTGAVLLFTGFFVVLVLLLDAGFKYLFEQILG